MSLPPGGDGGDDVLATLLARHLPSRVGAPVTALGEGWDNVAVLVDGEVVVRRSKEPDPERRAAEVRREADLLAVVARWSTVPVPDPVFVDTELGAMGYVAVAGTPLLDLRRERSHHPVGDAFAADLGRFLDALHRVPLAEVDGLAPRHDDPLAVWLDDASRDWPTIAPHLPTSATTTVRRFLDAPPPPDPDTDAVVFCHDDLGAEHLLVDPGTGHLVGVIDWADAAVTDPVHDLAVVRRDLGPAALDRVLEHLDRELTDADRARLVFLSRCALLDDLAYGVRTRGARRYADAALAALDRTFA